MRNANYKKMRFGDLAEIWLNDRKANVKVSTASRYEDIIRNNLNPIMGNEIVHDIACEENANTLESLSCYKYDTLKLIGRVFGMIMKFAGCDAKNTFQTLTKSKKRAHVISTLTAKECVALNRYLLENPTMKSLGVLIALNMGLRLGEVCGLEWSDINFIRRSITIKRTAQRVCLSDDSEKKTKLVCMPPKSISSEREVPVPIFVMNLLLSKKSNNDVFILSGNTDKPFEPRVLERYFNRISTRILHRNVKFHDLRHTFATLAISCGNDVKTVSEILDL